MRSSVPITIAALISSLLHSANAIATYGQCGGIGYTGSTVCIDAGASCVKSNDYYSQCLPSTSNIPRVTSIYKSSSSTSCPSNSPPSSAGHVQFSGVNIAGFDFGCDITGACNFSDTKPPLLQYGPTDGAGQMQHFVKDDKMNTFRLPVGWQVLVNNNLGGTLDATNIAKYDQLVRACLGTGASCIIDIHNYARWNGGIIGQGGPTNAQFVSVWKQLATKYKSSSKVIFGVMNEPHDVPSITTWASTVQEVVTAIRNAGATSQVILLPGNGWSSAGAFLSSGSGDALVGISNPDGSKTNLIFDIHKYLDSDNSGSHAECTTNNIDDAFAPLAQWLRCRGRKAFLSETGGGNTQSCVTYLGQQLAYVNANSDVFVGFTTWSAGAFEPSLNYVLTEVPIKNSGGTWTDQMLVKSAIVPNA